MNISSGMFVHIVRQANKQGMYGRKIKSVAYIPAETATGEDTYAFEYDDTIDCASGD